jgi:tRNA A58 N-methylase Trm61
MHQVVCAVKDPKNVMKEVWKLLRNGGKVCVLGAGME